ncbi:MAG: hypothetical protein ABFC94_14355 [Syntrophomonas sp.]
MRAWIDHERTERRFPRQWDGIFIVDGDTIDFRSIMEEKIPPGV